MKIKTWEKWYWGIDLVLIILSLIGYYRQPEKFTIGEEKRIMTSTEAIITILILYVGFASLLWLIIRYFVNKGDDKRERERER